MAGCFKLKWLLAAAALLMAFAVSPVMAQEAEAVAEAAAEAVETVEAAAEEAAAWDGSQDPRFVSDNLWVMIAGVLVFIMHLGFAMVETGFTRAKNTVNILFKNVMIVGIGFITYAICGFNLMYPGFDYDAGASGWFGFAGFGFLAKGPAQLTDVGSVTAEYGLAMTVFTDFFFQAVFAATCCTIISGAVAERIKLSSFLIFATLFVALVYPIAGSWKWGNGWLNNMETPFYDFAGSTLVHSVGGWGALIMAIILGPRLGKYASDGTANAIPGHNMTSGTIGVLLLWFGWYGFNGGSVLSADPGLISLAVVTTSLAAAAGGVAAMIISWVLGGKPDLSMTLNGILAGLVGITAGADQMSVMDSILIGLIAGALVYFAVLFVDKTLKIDDPVGAISVHLVCGIWGTLAVGIFGAKAGGAQLTSQIIGVIAYGLFTVLATLILGLIIKFTLGLRVSKDEEIEGLDLGEHDMAAYPDFQQTTIKSYQLREM